VINRGGVGVITLKTTVRNGNMVALVEVVDKDDLMIITQHGILIRLPISTIRTISRNTQGVKLIRLDEGDKISAVTRVVEPDNGQNGTEPSLLENGDQSEAEQQV